MSTKLINEIEELPVRHNRKTWLHLSPVLVESLERLAESDGITLEMLLISLINEALAYRLRHRR